MKIKEQREFERVLLRIDFVMVGLHFRQKLTFFRWQWTEHNNCATVQKCTAHNLPYIKLIIQNTSVAFGHSHLTFTFHFVNTGATNFFFRFTHYSTCIIRTVWKLFGQNSWLQNIYDIYRCQRILTEKSTHTYTVCHRFYRTPVTVVYQTVRLNPLKHNFKQYFPLIYVICMNGKFCLRCMSIIFRWWFPIEWQLFNWFIAVFPFLIKIQLKKKMVIFL